MEQCIKCAGSGIYIDYGGPDNPVQVKKCKYCEGKGVIDPNEVISVPRQFIMHKYFK